jgi:outer membrane protein assembly factor BamB
VALEGGKPAADVLAAAADKEPLRRAAVALVLGRAAHKHRQPLAALVKDPDARVRYHAAVSILRNGDRAGGKALLALLTEAPLPLAWRAEEILLRVAGEQPPKITLAKLDDDGRAKWRAEWEAWWGGNITRIDLARINFDDASLGLTIFCGDEKIGESPGFVYAVNRSGNVVWKLDGINSPADCHLLPGGRILVAQNWHSKVTEHDRSGKILLELTLPDKPVSCERLPNGNTFVATYNGLHEFTPDGKEVFAHKVSSMLHGGYKLRDGHMLTVDTNGNVEELDAKGERVHRFTPEKHAGGAGAWASVEVLLNGNYLIALSGTSRVIETDRMGKILWEAEVQTPTSATRLRNGHTLVSSVDGEFVVELDGMGKEVWRSPAWCRAFRVRRY